MARRIAGVAALALLSVLMAATCAAGRDFYVGGHAGWAPNPAEPFNAWAERNRFLVNDTVGELRSVSLSSLYSTVYYCMQIDRDRTSFYPLALTVPSSRACVQCSGTARAQTPCWW
jgi:hypothetical protein